MTRNVTAIQLPTVMDEFLTVSARRRMMSKGCLIREILLDHLKANHPDVVRRLERELDTTKGAAV